jgi:hypothetical protein
MSSDYRRYPAPGPSRRAVWIIIGVLVLLVVANVAHHAGVG